MFFVSCHWCGNHHGPPLTNHFLLTSAHYPRRWLRNFFLAPWSLHASMASSLCSKTCLHHWPLIEFFWECSTSTHVFTLLDCVVVPWGASSLFVVSLVPINNFHHWPIIRWFLPCSTSTHLFTWLDLYIGLIDIAVKTLGHIWFLVQDAWSYWVFMILYMIISIRMAASILWIHFYDLF